MKVKDVEIGKLVLAPMAGVTDVGFRKVARENGADFSYTEMINVNGLVYNEEKTNTFLYTEEIEKPVAIQLFGHDEKYFIEAVKNKYVQKFDVVDINMGCPAPKIVKNGEGVALMNNLPLAEKIIKAVVNNTEKPVTVKFRKGYGNKNDTCLELLKICEDNGVSGVTIHGRTHNDGYSGKADLEMIAKVKALSKIPVIGNGDVVDIESYNKMLETKVDAVMIGRGAFGRPWIFNTLKTGKDTDNKFDLIKEHIRTLQKYYDDEFLTSYIRKHLLWYIRDIDNTSIYREKLARTTDLDVALNILQNIFKK